MLFGLIVIFLLVLLLPLLLEVVERNLEIFLFIVGILAAVISGVMNPNLFLSAAKAPIFISFAVLLAGLLFKWFKWPIQRTIYTMSSIIPFKLFIFISITFLGLISSIVTAIIAALLLVLLVRSIPLERKAIIRLVVIGCFSIGLGAALTPTGEPLATIAINKLGADFFYLIRLIGLEILIGVILLSVIGAFIVNKPSDKNLNESNREFESYEEIIIRTLKIYFFVMGLTFLGEGFEPIIQKYFLGLSPSILYWINIASAILDNATLTAAEISPVMETSTIRSILLGLIISGGILIPGNIPNIIASGKLQITSKEWATIGVPIGLFLLTFYYFIIL